MEESVKRCRINFSQNAKGLVQRDVTGEAETAAEAALLMDEGLRLLEAAVHDRKLKFADEV